MKIKLTLIIFLTFVLITVKSEEYNYKSITTRNGLAQNDVHKIIQDSKKFIWIATNDGLNRFDGYDFKTYNKGYNGLQSNLIVSISEDKNSNIWISTADKGLFMYNRLLDKFIHLSEMTDLMHSKLPQKITRMLIDNTNNSIWVYESEAGIYKIQMNKEFNKAFYIQNFEAITKRVKNLIVRIFHCDKNGRVWIGTNKGIYFYDIKNNKFQKIKAVGESIISIKDIEKEKLGVLCSDKIVILNNLNFSILNTYPSADYNQLYFVQNSVFLANPNGLYKAQFDTKNNKIINEKKIDNFNNWKSSSIIVDNNNVIWVGFFNAGIRQYKIKSSLFKHLGGEKHIGNNFVSSLFQDNTGAIWIGTLGTGLFKYSVNSDIDANKVYPIDLLKQNKIYTITQSQKNGNIYIGTESITSNNVLEINPKTGAFKYLKTAGFSVRTLLVDSTYLWVGTYETGLLRYSLLTNKFTQINKRLTLNTEVIRSLIKDKKGNVWVGTDKGLTAITASSKFSNKLIAYKVKYTQKDATKNIDEYVLPIYESTKGDIWVGTLGDGVKQISNIQSNFNSEIKEYNTSNGLSNNTIKSIIEDNRGFIWVSTNKGLNKINPTKSEIELYDISDGLQDNEFSEMSGFKSKDGALLFGGVNGFNISYPDQIQIDTLPPVLVITDFLLSGQSVKVGERYNDRIILNSDISFTEEIELKYNQNNFSFVFAGIHYLAPSKNLYRYKLNGFDVDWTKSNSLNRIAKYTNIPPGEYQFMLEGSNLSGVWTNKPLIITVTVYPPIWATWYAYLFYLLVVVVIFIKYRKYLIKRQNQENEVMLAKLEKKRTKELMDMKVNFFTNISHEFRTPLTLILSPLQSFLSDKKVPDEIKKNTAIQTIEHNANILLKLINHLLNVSKHDQQKLEVQLKNKNFPNFINEVIHQFDFIAQSNNIALSFTSSSNEINIWFDPFLMEQIIYNLISNAFKYTPQGGKITLILKETPEDVKLAISDTGYGISKEAQNRIFERFFSVNSSENNNTINTGIGLALTKSLIEMHNGSITFTSEEGIGTTFNIIIPKNEIKSVVEVEENISLPENSSFDNSTIDTKEEAITKFDENITLLVVDDNLQIIKLLTLLFSPYYNVVSAMNGQEALEVIHDLLPNIIISDVMMPVMDGLQLCKLVKTDEKISHIPIILLSAKATTENQTEGYAYNADAYCPKPFDNKMLIALTKSIIFNKRMLAQQFRAEIDISPSKVTTTPSDEKFLRRIIQIIEDRIDDTTLSVEDLYSEIGMTANNLNKKLKALTNTTAKIFIRNIRLKRAAQLLKMQRYRVSDVAFEVGFTDIKHFRECFKKEFGLSPTEYKNEGVVDPDLIEEDEE